MMKRFLTYLGLLLPLMLAAQPMPRIKVGTYNIFTSDSRLKSVNGNDNVSPQRLWCNSYTAVGDMIVHMDCDILGLQEICDSIWNGPQNIRADVAAKGLRYEWILYPNTSHGHISYDDAIGYKPEVFECLKNGIFWMAGVFDAPEMAPDAPKGSMRPTVWAHMKHKASGKEFYFLCTHLLVSQRQADGKYNHEGNKYNTVQIGNQCWTKENMRCKTSPKGYLTEGGGNKSNYIPYYYDYATSPIPFEQRGYLYNWAGAVDTIDTENIIVSFSNRRGICPEGWHVPNDDEWTALEDYLKSQTECYSCSDNRNFIAKALASNEYWLDSSNDCAVGNDLAANNKTGFTLHPAGYNDGSRFFSSNDWAWLATSTSGLGYTAYNRTLLSGAGVVVKAYGGFETIGRSVRCLKD